MKRISNRIRCALRLTGLVAASISVTHCALRPAAESDAAAASGAFIDPPRSRRGNPPFYEVFGQRHYVLDSAAGYRKTGVASWYGEQFHGRATSSGETYDMYGLTAAHTTLPIPTWVEVTHLENRKRVIVKVNDRGPFMHDRIIDLSFGAAVALGVAASADRTTHRIYLQAGAFSQHGSANRLAGVLKEAGYRHVTIDAERAASPSLYRVRLGPFPDVDTVGAAIDKLLATGLEKPHLVIGPRTSIQSQPTSPSGGSACSEPGC